ncbi:hypothetical protein L6164_000278 [Bauhinia variegata]|uniref:Uncharacterized protein n=1 Tax=Bauhinia variegata TaxID=167791 RepID=A0ACB9Q5Z2_BAUVA|nr:hypothetical protein L6164_000278 [Bauhinia variegata]
MRASLAFLFFLITFHASFSLVTPQTDSCTCNLTLKAPIYFDTTNLHCLTVWNAQSFVLRYDQTSSNIWSFILSTPDTNSYIAMGFSASGGMVGSSAIVGWISAARDSGGIRQYYLGGPTPTQLQFQTNQPEPWLIYAVGPTGIFPSPPGFELTKHLDKTSTRMDYRTANVGSPQPPASASAPSQSQSQAADSCNSKLNLNAPLAFDTTNLNCVDAWSAEGFILRYSQTSANIWSFILSTPDTNSYIAIGFSPGGGMVGSSAIVGWVSSNGGGGGMKQYYLGGTTPNQVVPDRGNLQILTNSTLITSQSSRLYMAFQLQANQPQARLIYAVGPVGIFPSVPSFALAQHRDKASTSLNYATGSTSASKDPNDLKRSHGVLNILGWGILIIMGAIVARHFKEWDPFWFYFHVSVQSLGFVLGVIGVITGLVLEDQLQADVPIHKALGIIILVLALLQMMAILGRPDKESKVGKEVNGGLVMELFLPYYFLLLLFSR